VFFVSAPTKLSENGIPLILEFLVDTHIRKIITIHSSLLQSHKESPLERHRPFFVLTHSRENACLLLCRATGKTLSEFLFCQFVNRCEPVDPEFLNRLEEETNSFTNSSTRAAFAPGE
jgi:hypothetical protein